METLRLALVATTIALMACERNAGSDNAVSNDSSASNLSTDNGIGNPTNSSEASVDAAFVTEAMKGDNGEVAIGNLAAAQAASQAAKDFGRMLATDHGAHKEKLAALAARAGISIEVDPSDEAKTNLEKLKRLHGAEFDEAFKRMMIEDHTKDIAKYERQQATGDAQTSALAKETLPTLRKHLATAQSL
jgi:putative membrane protein